MRGIQRFAAAAGKLDLCEREGQMGTRRLLLSLGMFAAVAASFALFAGGATAMCVETGGCGGGGGGGGTGTGGYVLKGVNGNCSSAATSYDYAGGSQWARLFVRWTYVEPTAPDTADNDAYTGDPDRDDWNFTNSSGGRQSIPSLQACIQTLHNAGESVLVDLLTTPDWAGGATGGKEPPDASACDKPKTTQTDPTVSEWCYGSAAAQLVNFFAQGGSYAACSDAAGPFPNFCGIQAVEVWNEENSLGPDGVAGTGDEPYWTGTERQYEWLLQRAYQALNPLGVTVVTGGTVHENEHSWDNTLMNDEQNNAGGNNQCTNGPQGNIPTATTGLQPTYCFDALGVHTYAKSSQRVIMNPGGLNCSLSNPTNCANSPDIPAILDGTGSGSDTLTQLVRDLGTPGYPGHGLTSVPIWITEMGALAGTHVLYTSACLTDPIDGSHYWSDGTYRHACDSWSDIQNANYIWNFYNYLEGSPVKACIPPTYATATQSCSTTALTCSSATCSRVLVAMWFTDYEPSSQYLSDYTMLGETKNANGDVTGLYAKPEMTAFQNTP